jgi:CHASE1-domain containing sensor protein
MHNSRRVVLHPRYVEALRNTLREARADLHAQQFQFLCEVADLRRELDELREILALIVSITRQQAQADVATMRRQLETALVRLERRDPAQPLH